MDAFSVLTLLGSLTLFLFGVNQMGDGLERDSGRKPKSMLNRRTNNRIKGVILGTVVTAVIRSLGKEPPQMRSFCFLTYFLQKAGANHTLP